MKMKADSDSEGSSDLDVAVHFSTLTRSVFNITLDLPEEEDKKTNESTDYEKRLNSEIDGWLSLLKKVKQTISNSLPADTNTDYSALSSEKLKYLQRAPDLNEFIDQSIEFRKEANAYLENYAEILEVHENLAELCASRLDVKKSQIIEQCIFNIPRPHKEIN